MRKMTLRYCGALGGLLGPLLLHACQDNAQICQPVTGPDGTVSENCYDIGDFGTSTLAQSSEEPAGDNCPNGGKRIDTGFDDNDNGTLDANEDIIRNMVHQRAGWILRLAGLDEKLAEAIIDGLRRLTIDMAVDPAHPLRAKAEEGLARLAHNLQHDPETRAKVESWKEEMIDNEAVGKWIGGVWENSRAGLLRSARDPDAALAGKFGEALRQLGETLQKEPRLKKAINQFARRAAGGIVASYGGNIVKLVSETVRAWDARTVSDRLEGAVGRDLQYIRINGTLVGGLVGLAIHTAEVAL